MFGHSSRTADGPSVALVLLVVVGPLPHAAIVALTSAATASGRDLRPRGGGHIAGPRPPPPPSHAGTPRGPRAAGGLNGPRQVPAYNEFAFRESRGDPLDAPATPATSP